MCRHAAYLGDPIPLAALTSEGTHGLERQSYEPRELLSGVVCADGFGIGWHDPGGGTPRYRREQPIWADPDLAAFGASVHAGSIVGAVRNATPGMAGGIGAVQPFALDGVLFSHNGLIAGFSQCARTLRESLPRELDAQVRSGIDSELLFLHVVARRRGGATLAEAVTATLSEVSTLAPGSRLNLIASDRAGLVATRAAAGTTADSLYMLERGGRFANGVAVASEPLDDHGRWSAVPEGALVEIAAAAHEVEVRTIPTLETIS